MSGEDAQAYKPDIADLLKAVNGASAAARNAWLGFIALMAYLAVTLAGIGHKDLLLDAPTLLPFVNVKIPLTSFFLFGPLVLLFAHFGLLIQHAMLFEKLINFKTALKAQGLERHIKAERPSVYSEVHSYFFTQSIVGGAKKRRLALAFRFMTMLTLVIVPFALFFYFQVKFLPFHREDFTWAHRIYLLADLFLLWKIGDYLRHVRCEDVIVSPSPLRAILKKNYKVAKGRVRRGCNKGVSSLNRGLAKRRVELRQWVRDRLSFAKVDEAPEPNAKLVYNQILVQKVAADFVSFFTKPVFWERFMAGLQAGFQGLKKAVGGLFYSLWHFVRWCAGQISFLRCLMGGIVVLSLFVATVPDGFVDKGMNEFATQADRKLYKVAKGVKEALVWDWVLRRLAIYEKEEGEETVGLITRVPIYCNRKNSKGERTRRVFTPTAWLFERKVIEPNWSEIEFLKKRIERLEGEKKTLSDALEKSKIEQPNTEKLDFQIEKLSEMLRQLKLVQKKYVNYEAITSFCSVLDFVTADRNLDIINEDLVPDKKDAKEVSHSLRGRDFNYARFDGTDLKRVDLRGAQLKYASFIDSTLSDAKIKNTTFEGAILKKVKIDNVDFEDSFFVGADLRDIDFSTVKNLHKADLRNANLEGAKLEKFDFKTANLHGANFSKAILTEADFSEAYLGGADFSNSVLSGANFSEARLDGADFGNASLEGSNLFNARLAGADFSGSFLRGSDLEATHLYGANLENAFLEGANLYWSGLAGANLSGASLKGAELSIAILQGTNLTNAKIEHANFHETKIWASTLPEDKSTPDLSKIIIAKPNYEDKGYVEDAIERLKTLADLLRDSKNPRFKKVFLAWKKLQEVNTEYFTEGPENNWAKGSPKEYAGWQNLKKHSAKRTKETSKDVGRYLGTVGCNLDGGNDAYVAQGLIRRFVNNYGAERQGNIIKTSFWKEFKKCENIFKKIPEATMKKFQKFIEELEKETASN